MSATLAAEAPATRAQQERQEIFDELSPSRLKFENIDWPVLGFLVAMHVGALAAPFFFSWSAVGVALLFHWLTASVGVCLGFHRYLSHRSLKLKTPAKFFTLLCGTLSAEGAPRSWAAIHRLHHAQSDKEGDPHSPLVGPWWAHFFWMTMSRCQRFNEMLFRRYAPDLAYDRMLMFFEKTFLWWQLVLGVALYAAGGWPWVVWGLFVRTVACYHSTWFVNSATHLWGYRNYETRDESRNLWWVALLAYGEGWHNNHHAHPRLARAGHRWWEVDMTFWSIRFLQAIGQATEVVDEIPSHREPAPARPASVVRDRPADPMPELVEVA